MKQTKLVFIDAAGHPSLKKVQEDYPFYSAFACIIDAEHYFNEIEHFFDEFKEKWFEKPDVVLHYREMTANEGYFKFLENKDKRIKFQNDLQELLNKSKFVGIQVMINKIKLIEKYNKYAYDPSIIVYDNLMRRINYHLQKREAKAHVFIEAGESGIPIKKLMDEEVRSKKIDTIRTYHVVKKETKLHGLQIPDLLTTPIVRHVNGRNPTIVDGGAFLYKLESEPETGKLENWGLVIFPK